MLMRTEWRVLWLGWAHRVQGMKSMFTKDCCPRIRGRGTVAWSGAFGGPVCHLWCGGLHLGEELELGLEIVAERPVRGSLLQGLPHMGCLSARVEGGRGGGCEVRHAVWDSGEVWKGRATCREIGLPPDRRSDSVRGMCEGTL